MGCSPENNGYSYMSMQRMGTRHRTNRICCLPCWWQNWCGLHMLQESMLRMTQVLSWALIIVSVLSDTILTCNQIMLHKRTKGPPVRQGLQSPTDINKNLNLCGHWCADTNNCCVVSWEPGFCGQVGLFTAGASWILLFYCIKQWHGSW